MSAGLALELNDAGLRVAGAPGVDWEEATPGWAVVEPGSILTGADAAARMRLNPRLAHRRFWTELDLNPLPRPFPDGLSSADLAYSQLNSIWAGVASRGAAEPQLLAASGAFTPEQLGLVLGIAKSLESPFTGLVDSAVAAASTRPAVPCLVLDFDLERAVATSIVPTDSGTIARQQVQVREDSGWNRLMDLWARAVGREFVRKTRFDPLHTAPSEQGLYLSLPRWIDALVEADLVDASLEAGGREHRVTVGRQHLVEAAAPVYAVLTELVRGASVDGGELLLTDRVARLPGLPAVLAEAGLAASTGLSPDAVLAGTLQNADAIHQPDDPRPLWVLELPAAGNEVETQPVPVEQGTD